ncbi:MAG: cell wall-binding repeat-containing protein [Desulfosporosinus sp.]|nr:cell wall-binding repeat-containing protein [Desulfosporosinus sp.]
MKKHKKLAGLMTATLACSMLIAQPLLASAATTLATAVPTMAPINALQRLSGQDRYETAAKIAEQGWTTSSKYAILAAGMDANLVDALTAAPLAKAMNAPILLTQGDSLNSFAVAELQRLGVKTVYVTSGTGVIQSAVTDQLSTMGITVIPLGGSDRFATAVNIAQSLASVAPVSQVVVATAYSNADALSVAGIAAAQGMPILLTDVNSLPTATATYINSLSGITHSFVVGGTGVVSDAVMTALPHAQRAGGVDRFDTNRQILKQFAPQLNYGQIYVSNGEDAHLVDALAVAPLAAQTRSAVVMSDQQVPADTLTYVKSNLLPKTITALGGESVLPSASLSGLSSALVYANAGDTAGSTDPNNKAVMTDSVRVTGDNVTVQNAVIPNSIYVTGNKANLTNLQVTGTIFLDPGASGVATLTNVKAANIVVLSGATSSIVLINVTADTMTVNSTTNVHVEASGTTAIGNTYVVTQAMLDSASGGFGDVYVIRALAPGQTIVLQGTFTHPVEVDGTATITAAPGAIIPQLTIAPGLANSQVTLNGSFASVTVNTVCNVTLGGNAVVASMTDNAPANVQVPPTASITSLTNSGSSPAIVSGGGTVNGTTTPATPSSPSTPVVSGGGGGGGGGGSSAGGGGTQTLPATQILSFAILNGSNTVGVPSGSTVDLSGMLNDQRITALSITASPADSTLQLTGLTSPTGAISFSNKTFPLSSPITMSGLLGSAIQGGDVSLGSLRALFGNKVTFNGTLTEPGCTPSSVSLTLTLGSTTGTTLNTQWATTTANPSTHVITAIINQANAPLSTIGISNVFMSAAGSLPVSVSTDGTNWYAPGSQNANIKTAIVYLINGGPTGVTTWENAYLGQLAGHSIQFKVQSDVMPWTVSFS